jgi:hypothetical protein
MRRGHRGDRRFKRPFCPRTPYPSTRRPCDLPGPAGPAGTGLYVADAGHNRVLGWTGIPTSNGTAADLVIGQSSFTLAAANDDAQTGTDGTAPTARTLAFPIIFRPHRRPCVTRCGADRRDRLLQ